MSNVTLHCDKCGENYTEAHEHHSCNAVNEWIAVKDRMPKEADALEGHPVLVYSLPHDLVEVGEWRGDAWHVWLTHGLHFGEVDYWRELPLGPK